MVLVFQLALLGNGCPAFRGASSEELVAFPGWYLRVVVKKNNRTGVVRKCEFYRILRAGIELGRCVVELERYEFSALIDRLRVHYRPVHGPDRAGNEKGVDRIRTDRLNGLEHLSAGPSTYFHAGNLPPLRGQRLLGKSLERQDSESRCGKHKRG